MVLSFGRREILSTEIDFKMHQIQRYILRAGFPEHEPSFDMVISMQGLNGLIGKFPEIGKLSTLHYRDDQSLTSQVVGTVLSIKPMPLRKF